MDIAGCERNVPAVVEVEGPVRTVMDLSMHNLAAAAVIAGDALDAAALKGAILDPEGPAVHKAHDSARAAEIFHILCVPGGKV